MKKIMTLVVAGLLFSITHAQTVGELYNKKDYQAVVKFERDADKLTPFELYMVGFAFFQLENDTKAIAFYNKAISKGLDSAFVHYDKALSLRYAKRLDESLKEFDIAIQKAPYNQMYMSEKGFAYYYSDQLDKALPVFLEAQKLPNDFYAPFYMVGHIYHLNKEFDRALKEFNNGLTRIAKSNKYYLLTLADIGNLEYTVTKNFGKSVAAYQEAVNLSPKNYELYPKLIKAYNANKEYAKADTVFDLLKTAFEKKELSEEDMKYKNAAIDEYEWKGQKVTIYKSFVTPQKTLDILFKIYLLNKEGDKVERSFMTEQTIQLEPDGAKHLLCEKDKKSGAHRTYPYGWNKDNISVEEIRKAVNQVLDGKMTPAASSNFGN
jgi:tetratricopeptide (TPR) repeat protein